MKKSKNIVLIVTPVLSAALLNGCAGSQPRPVVSTATTTTTSPAATTPYPLSTVAPEAAQTRDVYNNLDDCIKDWGDAELCEQMGDDDDRIYRSRYKTKGAGKYFYGPGYSANNRIITYKGKTVSPTGKVSKLPSYVSAVTSSKTTGGSSTVPTSKTTSTTSTSSTTSTTTLPSTTGKSTTSSTSPSTTTSSTSSTSTYNPSSSYSSTTRGGFGTTSSSSSSSSSSGS